MRPATASTAPISKVYQQLRRDGEQVGRDRRPADARAGIAGAVRGKTWRTTIADLTAQRAPVWSTAGFTAAPSGQPRGFTAARPNKLFVADFTYVPTWSGTVYVAFVIDVFSPFIVGCRAATTMRTELGLDALKMATWRGDGLGDEALVCHSDAGSEYTSIRYTDRLAEIGAAPSIGSIGDSFYSALTESTIGLFRTEPVRRHGPWHGGWSPRTRDLRVHRLVQPPTAAQRDRRHPASRAGSQLLRSTRTSVLTGTQ